MTDPADDSRDRVLLVDDTRTNISILMAALKDDYKLGVATNGEKALEYVQRTPPDLILLDIMMPEMDGYEVCSRLKGDERTRHIPIIFLTALTEVDEKVKGFALGAVDYVTKPFEVVEVQARVRTHLQLERLRRELAAQNLALADAHARLSRQVVELEGCDRLVRFQMANDSIPAAYQEILAVVQDVLDIPGAVLYRPSVAGDQLEPRAALGASGAGGLAPASELDLIPAEDTADGTSHVARAFRERRPRASSKGEAAIPIVYIDDVLGVIATSGLATSEAEQEATLGVLWRLAGEAALVIRAAQVAEDLSAGRLESEDLIALADEEAEAATP